MDCIVLLKEALNNIAKHSRANHVSLILDRIRGRIAATYFR